MRKIIAIMIILLLTIGLSTSVFAQDGGSDTCTTNPTDGSGLPECGTPADNECFAGGVFEGKCDSPWMWNAGWYLARFNQGQISREDFPAFYGGVLPPVVEVVEEAVEVVSGGGGTPPLISLCRFQFCAYSDKTGGTLDINTGSYFVEVQIFLAPGTVTCPAGYAEVNTRPITNWHGGVFSDADLAPLGMDNTWRFCFQAAP